MRMTFLAATGLLVALLLIALPVSAAAVNAGGAGAGQPTMIVEYGKGKDLGLVKVTHIHYAKNGEKGSNAKVLNCYDLARYKWIATSLPIRYMIQDVAGRPALSGPIADATLTWGTATSTTLFATAGASSGKTPGVRDYVNLVTYGDIPRTNVIAITTTWYTTATKVAVESDIEFDTGYTWGDAMIDPTVMDVQNIATHEIGHTLGLNDLYSGSCNAVTMYGYSKEGDVGKRTLETQDISGLRLIYGA